VSTLVVAVIAVVAVVVAMVVVVAVVVGSRRRDRTLSRQSIVAGRARYASLASMMAVATEDEPRSRSPTPSLTLKRKYTPEPWC